MRLTELADLLDLDIWITRQANSNGRYIAGFADSVEFKLHKHDSVRRGCAGHGDSFQSALQDLRATIQGKWLVIDAADESKRREFGVPQLHAL